MSRIIGVHFKTVVIIDERASRRLVDLRDNEADRKCRRRRAAREDEAPTSKSAARLSSLRPS